MYIYLYRKTNFLCDCTILHSHKQMWTVHLPLYPDCNIDNLFNLSNSNGYMVESHYSFNLNFSDDWWWWNLSAYWIYLYIFSGNIYSYCCLILWGSLSYFGGERVLLTKFYVFFFFLIIKVFKNRSF